MSSESEQDPRQFIQEHLQRGDDTGWFEQVYRNANAEGDAVPWAMLRPRPAFAEWAEATGLAGHGKRAVVIGCGLGDDAEALARRSFAVTAFDISPTAVAWCKARFPHSTVNYQVADLFAPPQEWLQAFDFVLEIFTVQALPIARRAETVRAVVELVAPGGQLFVFTLATTVVEGRSGPPWPLTVTELQLFNRAGLVTEQLDEQVEPGADGTSRFRALFVRPAQRG